MSTKDLVLFGMSANCRAALGVSTKSHRLLGICTKPLINGNSFLGWSQWSQKASPWPLVNGNSVFADVVLKYKK